MGRYIAITMPPITTPSTTMIIGSIRLVSASTASSTSASKKSATLPSMESRDPDSSPIDTIWVTMLGKRSEEHTSELQSHSDLVCRLLLVTKHKSSNET